MSLTYFPSKLEELDDPYERVFCGVVMQAMLDLRIPGYQKDISNFFHGPLVGASGLDGDMLMEMAEKRNRRYT